ncbi:MAG: hypothetical protein J6J64_00265 [Alistipes sp.]|nr:hypothetical protein [Alistipes sp.]
MKNIKFLFLALATLVAGAFTACQEDWTPGPVDSDKSVYLPVDVNVAAFPTVDDESTPDVDERLRALFPVYRQNTNGELTVEFRTRLFDEDLSFILERDEEGNPIETLPVPEAFKFDESVTFVDGENVAYLGITLNEVMLGRISVGELFDAEIMVKDPQYHGNYGLYRKVISFGIPETWNPVDENLASNEGILFDDFLSGLYGQPAGNGAPVVIEESGSRPGYYRLVNPFKEENAIVFIGGIPSDMSFAPGDTYLEVDARDPNNVFIPYQNVGVSIEGWGDVYIGMTTNTPGTLGVLKDGIITFPANCMGVFQASGSGNYANTSGLFRIVLPGVSLVDYSMSVACVGMETSIDNTVTNAILNFATGADVEKFRFAVVKGDHPITSKVSTGIGKFEEQYHEAITNLIDDEYEPTDEDTMAEATPSQNTWYVSFDESDLYTVFAVPYNANGEPIMENIASTFFYYRAAGSTTEAPEMPDMKVQFGSVANVMGNPQYEASYPAPYILCLNVAQEDGKYLSAVASYFAETAKVEAALAAGETFESLLASADAQDMSDAISGIAAGQFDPLLFNNLTPDTEYTVIVGTTNIYGQSAYYRADAKTAKYNGFLNIGVYEFTDGNSKMQIKFKPFFNQNYGQMFLITWVGDDLITDEGEPMELSFVTYSFPDYGTVACSGQIYELGDYFFNVPIDYYNGDKSKFWGYRSSSTADYEYANESFVMEYDNNGNIVGIQTYFQKYVVDTEGNMEVLAEFDPATTTVKLIESHMPTPEEPATFSAPRKSFSKIGVYTGTIDLTLRTDLTPVSIK